MKKSCTIKRQCTFRIKQDDGETRKYKYGDPIVLSEEMYEMYKDYLEYKEDVPEDPIEKASDAKEILKD